MDAKDQPVKPNCYYTLSLVTGFTTETELTCLSLLKFSSGVGVILMMVKEQLDSIL